MIKSIKLLKIKNIDVRTFLKKTIDFIYMYVLHLFYIKNKSAFILEVINTWALIKRLV